MGTHRATANSCFVLTAGSCPCLEGQEEGLVQQDLQMLLLQAQQDNRIGDGGPYMEHSAPVTYSKLFRQKFAYKLAMI